MWSKVETDASYRALARRIWSQAFDDPLPNMETPEQAAKTIDAKIAQASVAITTLRERGVRMLFVRPPSSGPYYDRENRLLPRASTWDLLLARTGVPGIHFEDYPELQGYDLPEWSHLSAAEAERFTEALASIVEREFARLEREAHRGSRPRAQQPDAGRDVP